MECTLNASQAASKALDDIRHGRVKIITGERSHLFNLKPDSDFRVVISCLILLISMSFFLYDNQKSNCVSGTIHCRDEIVANAEILFASRDGENHFCTSDDEGKFKIRLPKGKYRIYKVEGSNKTISQTALNCAEDIELRIFFR